MAASALSAPCFYDEATAYVKLESVLWPRGPFCHTRAAIELAEITKTALH